MLRPRRHLLLAVLLSFGFMACKSTKQTREDAPIPARAFWPMKQSDIMRTGYALAPNLIERPAIAWKAKVGLQTRHNSPVVSDDTVYTGSAGEREGEADAMDGVYALDLTTGKQRWFTPFQGDVHGTSWLGGNIIVTAGKQGIWALDASTGERRCRGVGKLAVTRKAQARLEQRPQRFEQRVSARAAEGRVVRRHVGGHQWGLDEHDRHLARVGAGEAPRAKTARPWGIRTNE